MGLKFRRGTTAQQSGSLAFGEPYVNTTLGTLVVGGPTGDIVLGASGTGSTGNFGPISGSGLDITGNANIAGNLTLGGKLTIGDNTTDTVNVVASLSSSLIPSVTNAFDLGSENYFWRDLYISTGSIKFVGAAGTVVGTLSNAANGMILDSGIVANGNSSFGTSSLAVTSVTGSLRVSGSLNVIGGINGVINATNGVVSGSSQLPTLATTGSNTFRGTQTFDSDILLGTGSFAGITPATKMTIGNGFGQNPTNIAIGRQVLDNVQITENTGLGMFNIGIGSTALTSVTTGNLNMAVGDASLLRLSTGTQNVALGNQTGYEMVDGDGNVFVGHDVARLLAHGNFNIGIGIQSLLGANAVNDNFVHNTAIGANSGEHLSGSSSNNILIGKLAGPQSAQEISDKLYIGHLGYPLLTGSLEEGNLSFTINGATQVSGAVKATSFSGQILANNGVLSGSLVSQLPVGVISGSSQLNNTTITNLTITNLTTVNQTASVLFSSGSNKFGDFSNDTHEFTGSVQISGSIVTIGTSTATSFNGAINATNGVVSGSSQVIGILSSLNTYTGSNDTTNTTQNTRLTALEASASTALSTNGTQATSITNLNSATASLLIETANLETFSSSALTRLSALEVETSNLETFSGSALTRLSNLEGTDISITLTGDVTGTGTITNLANVSFATTIAANSVALGTDTTGDYVASLVQGTGVTITNNSGESATPTIAIGQAVATSSNVQFNSLGVGMAASATAGRIDATNDIVAYSSSDIRFKENIKAIENPIEKIRKISGNTYDWKAENKIEHGYEGNDVGVIAQEIEAVLPQLVQTRDNGYKAVKYDKLVALLIEGIKEQQTQIENLSIEIENLKKQKGL